MFKTCSCLLLCVLCGRAVQSDDAVITRLRQHGDYAAIERYCREKLKTPGLSLEARTECVAELAGSLAQQANAATDSEQAGKQWAESDRLLAEFVEQNPKHPRAPFFLRQRTIYGFAEGESLRRAAEFSQDPVALALSRKRLERAAELATQLDQTVRQALDAYNAKASRLEFKELVALSNDVPYRLGQIHLSLARTHRPDSEEQKRALDEAAERFEFYTREGYSDDELIVRSHIALAECRRLQRDFAAAVKVLATIEQSKTTTQALKDEALALRMHCLLDQNQLQAARAVVQGRTRLSPELALTVVRGLLAEAKAHAQGGDQPAAVRAQAAAIDAVAVGEREHGAAWQARAEALLANEADLNRLGSDLQAAMRLGDALLRRRQIARAAAAYARAAEIASLTKQSDVAFDLGLKAARLQAQSGQERTAFERLRQLVERAPSELKAAEASCCAAETLVHFMERDRSGADFRDLAEWLDRHIRRFPNDATTPTVRFWAGRVARRRGDARAAIAYFSAIPVAHPQFSNGIYEFTEAYLSLRPGAAPADAARLTSEGCAGLVAWQKAAEAGDLSEPVAKLVRYCLQIARGRLLVWPGALTAELSEARQVLETLLRQGCRDESVQDALLLALVGLEDFAAADRLAQDFTPAQDHRFLTALRSWQPRVSAHKQADLARLQLAVIRSAVHAGPPADEARELGRDEAWALARLGRGEEARSKLAELRREHARDAALAEEHARVLMHLATPQDFTDAAGLWQALAASHKEGTEKWLEAKYQLAACYGKLGQKERALKVLRLTSDLWLSDADATLDDVRKRFRGQFKALETELSK